MLKTHAIVDIDSKDRNSGTISNFNMIFNHPINFNSKRQYFTRIEKVRLPISFYNIHNESGTSNGTLKVTEDPSGTPDLISVTVPNGNYTESELRTTIVSLLNAATLNVNTYTMTFDDITGHITITSDTTEFRIESQDSGSTINQQLGFSDSSSTFTSTSLSVTSNIHVSLSTRRYLNLNTDLSSDNHYTKTVKKNVHLRIPITQSRHTIQYYDNHEGHTTKLDNFHNIKDLRFTLTDNDNTIVDMNGVDYSFQIVFYEFRI